MNRSAKKILSHWLILSSGFFAGASAAVFGHALFCALGSPLGSPNARSDERTLEPKQGLEWQAGRAQWLIGTAFSTPRIESPAVLCNRPGFQPHAKNRVVRTHPAGFRTDHRERSTLVGEQIAYSDLDIAQLIAKNHESKFCLSTTIGEKLNATSAFSPSITGPIAFGADHEKGLRALERDWTITVPSSRLMKISTVIGGHSGQASEVTGSQWGRSGATIALARRPQPATIALARRPAPFPLPHQEFYCFFVHSGGEIRTPDLQVMSLMSYHCSTPHRFVLAQDKTERNLLHVEEDDRIDRGAFRGSSGQCFRNMQRDFHAAKVMAHIARSRSIEQHPAGRTPELTASSVIEKHQGSKFLSGNQPVWKFHATRRLAIPAEPINFHVAIVSQQEAA